MPSVQAKRSPTQSLGCHQSREEIVVFCDAVSALGDHRCDQIVESLFRATETTGRWQGKPVEHRI